MTMPHTLDPLAEDVLAQRLDAMEIQTPTFTLTTSSARSLQRPALRRRLVRHTGRTMAIVLTVCLTSTVAIAAGIAVISHNALRDAGLTPAQVSPVAGEARQGSSSVAVSGAYADEVSTVVFADITMNNQPCDQASAADVTAGNCGYESNGPYLTDQFGQRYETTGGVGIGVGPYPIFFQPLRGQAANGNGQLTLHVPLNRYTKANNVERYELDVALSGRLAPSVAKDLPAPMPVIDATHNVTFEVVSLRSSGTYLSVHTRLSGQLQNVIASNGGGMEWPGVYLVDASGKYHIPVAGGGPGQAINEQIQDESRVFAAPHGTYRLVVAQGSNPGGAGTVILAEWTVTI